MAVVIMVKHGVAKHSAGVLTRIQQFNEKTTLKWHFVHYDEYPVFEIAQYWFRMSALP